MGTCLTFHLAGGDAGIEDFMKQFGPTLKLPWTQLAAPELSDELIARMAEGTRRQAGGRTIRELERLRDDCVVAIIQAAQTLRDRRRPRNAHPGHDAPLAVYEYNGSA